MFQNLLAGSSGFRNNTFFYGWILNDCCWGGTRAGDLLPSCWCHLHFNCFWVYGSVVLTIFTLLCDRYLGHFLSCKTGTLYPLNNNSPLLHQHPKILLMIEFPSTFKIQFWFYLRQERIFIENLYVPGILSATFIYVLSFSSSERRVKLYKLSPFFRFWNLGFVE